MGYPALTYNFTDGDRTDAPKINANFSNLLNGLSNGNKDINILSATVNNNITVTVDLISDLMVVDTTFEAQKATSEANIFIDGVTLQEGLMSVSGTTAITLDAGVLSDHVIAVDQSFNKLVFPNITSAEIKNIATAEFVDGDIITLTNQWTTSPGNVNCLIRNSDVSGNIHCGSDINFKRQDVLSFIYNGIQDTFDLIGLNRSSQDFF